jgi:hypothetical protein
MASQALVVATRHSVADVAEEETVRNRGRKGWRELNIDFPARRQDLFDLLYGIKFERNDYSMCMSKALLWSSVLTSKKMPMRRIRIEYNLQNARCPY